MRHAVRIAIAVIASVGAPLPASSQAPPRWQLVEDLRIGSEASQMTAFGDIRGIVEGDDGRIFVLDYSAQEIRMFDRTGRFLALAARRGQGPGEIADANGLIRVKDAIWANDPENGRWPAYSATDGKYLRQIAIPINSHGYIWQVVADAEGRIVDPIHVRTARMDRASGEPVQEPRLRRLRTDGSGVDTVAAPDCPAGPMPAKTRFTGTTPGGGGTTMSIPFLAYPVTSLDGQGGYWCSPNHNYTLVHRMLGKADTLHTIRMPYTRVPVSAEQRATAIENAQRSLARRAVIDADYSLIPNVHPVFSRLDVDDKGQLWARRVAPPGGPWTIDLYDRSGRPVATVVTPLEFRAYGPVHFRGDQVYGVVQDADGVQHVVRARLVRR